MENLNYLNLRTYLKNTPSKKKEIELKMLELLNKTGKYSPQRIEDIKYYPPPIVSYYFNEAISKLRDNNILSEIPPDFGSVPESDFGPGSGFGPGTDFKSNPDTVYESGIDLLNQKLKSINMSNQLNYNISFKYHNLTKNLCKSENEVAQKLEEHVKKYFPKFNINNFHKFNPSIVCLSDTRYLMSYRIYMGYVNCDNYDLVNCHPWSASWGSQMFGDTPEKNITKANYLGLCILDNNFIVLDDIILKLNDEPLGIEDCRLFKHNDKVYIAGALAAGIRDIPQIPGVWVDRRILRQVIITLGDINNLLNKIPRVNYEINYNCNDLHTLIIEKNWFGYTDNTTNQNIILNPTFPNFFPLKQYKLFLDELVIPDNNFIKDQYKNSKIKNSTKCTLHTDIKGNDLMQELNNKYEQFLLDPTKQLFRFSGGSWGINYDDNTKIFVGHIVVYVFHLNIPKVLKYIEENPSSQLSYNLYHFLYNRQNQLKYGNGTLRYYNILFLINLNLGLITKLSHCFNIFETKDKDTSINFPSGLDKINDKYIMSLGESDSNVVILEIESKVIDDLFINTSAEDYKFMTFDSTGKQIYYSTDNIVSGGTNNKVNILNDKYYAKYMKYKQKYINKLAEINKKY
jgi:hypothetical protein